MFCGFGWIARRPGTAEAVRQRALRPVVVKRGRPESRFFRMSASGWMGKGLVWAAASDECLLPDSSTPRKKSSSDAHISPPTGQNRQSHSGSSGGSAVLRPRPRPAQTSVTSFCPPGRQAAPFSEAARGYSSILAELSVGHPKTNSVGLAQCLLQTLVPCTRKTATFGDCWRPPLPGGRELDRLDQRIAISFARTT